MFHEYGFDNDGKDATRSCQSHQRDDHMEEQNEDVAHAAWYQTALTSGISAGLVIRHAQANHWKKSYGIWVVPPYSEGCRWSPTSEAINHGAKRLVVALCD